jgi:EF-hand domain-containing family member B
LFPESGEKHEAPEVAAMYLKTHGDFAPGQQKERGYNWPVDKTDHRFGYVENERELNGAAKCLQPERYGSNFPQTKILKKTVEDYIEVTKDDLGKVKNLGQGADPVKVVGTKIKRPGDEDAWNAALCIHGDPGTQTEIQPDKDLGKCTKVNCTNTIR